MTSQPELAPVTPPPRPRDDRVGRARGGDMDAWAGLYQDHFDGLFRHVCYLTGDASAAEDLVQETFARALTRLARFEGRGAFGTWLHGIAINVVRGHWRAHQATARAHRRLRDVGTVRGATDDAVDRADLRRRRSDALYEVLQEISEPLREAFILLDLEGLRPAEAAAQLDISAGNVSVRAHRARGKIQERLRALGWLDDDGGPR